MFHQTCVTSDMCSIVHSDVLHVSFGCAICLILPQSIMKHIRIRYVTNTNQTRQLSQYVAHIHTHKCIRTYTCIHTEMHAHVHSYTYTSSCSMYVCVCVCVVRVHVYMYNCMCTHVSLNLHIYRGYLKRQSQKWILRKC